MRFNDLPHRETFTEAFALLIEDSGLKKSDFLKKCKITSNRYTAIRKNGKIWLHELHEIVKATGSRFEFDTPK